MQGKRKSIEKKGPIFKRHFFEEKKRGCKKLTFEYIWTHHLSQNNKECALVGTKHKMTTTKATIQPQLQIFVFLVCQPPISVYFCDLVYVLLVARIVQNSCINHNLPKY